MSKMDGVGADRSPDAGAFPDPQDWVRIPTCGSKDLTVAVRWTRVAVGLEGQVVVENISGDPCRLSHKPWVVPLGTDGRELPVEVVVTADMRLRPVILDSGRRAAAPRRVGGLVRGGGIRGRASQLGQRVG
jgi:Protein of unknown function (DUF4232)